MAASLIARNYAETLFTLAQRQGGQAAVEEYGRSLDEIGGLLRREPRIREFLETPRLDTEAKKRALREALAGRVPELVLRFLLVVLDKGRQQAIPEIAVAYQDLVDETLNRVRADIQVAREPDAELQRRIVASLEARLGKTVVPTFRVEPHLVGGVRIRVGEQILDGSLRRQLQSLRRRLQDAPLPQMTA